MTPDDRRRLVAQYRQRDLRGNFVDLVPMNPEHTEALLALRNTERAIYGLAQGAPLTKEMHQAWYRNYLLREDDLAWMIKAHNGPIIGTISLYAIDPSGSTTEKGRLVVDERWVLGAPYVIDTDLLILRLAFETFQVNCVIITVRPENKKVISAHLRNGFHFTRAVELRATPYSEYALEKDAFNPVPYETILTQWAQRRHNKH